MNSFHGKNQPQIRATLGYRACIVEKNTTKQ